MTVGEAVDQHGYCELMMRIADLATVLKRVPFGEWEYRFVSDPTWRVCVNGGTAAEWTPPDASPIPRFHAMVEKNGLPAAIFNAAGGSCLLSEGKIIAAVDAEIAHAKAGIREYPHV